MKIVIETSGGVINMIYSDVENMKVIVIDHDNHDAATSERLLEEATQHTPYLVDF